MAKAKALDRRRKSIRSIRKITRTMELISTARFRKAMDRAVAASAYTKRIIALVGHLTTAGLEVKHPLLETHAETSKAVLLVLSANRGLCGGYNGSVLRHGLSQLKQLQAKAARRSPGSLRQAGHFGLSLPENRHCRALHAVRRQADLRPGGSSGQSLPGMVSVGPPRPLGRRLHEV